MTASGWIGCGGARPPAALHLVAALHAPASSPPLPPHY